jgi:copper homeostasis protein
MVIEACVDSLSQALLAQARGAHRIELCSRLDLDGLSPSAETIREALFRLKIGIKVMIRPRSGNFIYSEEEMQQMEREILFCKEAGIREIVLGASLPGGRLDIPAIRRLAEAAAPMTITIHKAIDDSPDPLADLEDLRPLTNVTHILSSGGQPTALEGAPLLREMIRRFGDRFAIIAAGKITRENLLQVHEAIGAAEYHGKKIAGSLR